MHCSRHLAVSAAVSSALALAACRPVDKQAAGDHAKTEDARMAEGADENTGLATEKQRLGYMLGMDIGNSLKPVKDDIDTAALRRAIDDVLADKKPLLDAAQVEQVKDVWHTKAAKRQAEQERENEKRAAEMAARSKTFLAENAKKPGVVTTASGLQYQVVKAGKGRKPKADDAVKVHYTGTLLDGTKFESSLDRGEPSQFLLSMLVPGWAEAMTLMPEGSTYKVWVPAELGYGEIGLPGSPIPPRAMLVLDVQLLEILER